MGLLDFEKYAPQRRTSGDPHGVKLREAVRTAARGQCPLCTVLEDQERARVHWLAYEGLSDIGLRKRLARAKGLCRAHFRLLYGVVTTQTYNVSGVADVMRDLLQADREALTRALAETRRGRRARKALAVLRSRARCPLCEAATESAESKVDTLLEELTNDSFLDEYVSSPGLLCRPHLLLALTKDPAEAIVGPLLEKHLRVLDADARELDEYLRKKDYRFSDEPKGAEQQAPLRSIETYVGTWPA
jgi:hypothetical protein